MPPERALWARQDVRVGRFPYCSTICLCWVSPLAQNTIHSPFMLMLLSQDGVGWAAVSLGHLGLQEASLISALPLSVRERPQSPRLFPRGPLCKSVCICLGFQKKMGWKEKERRWAGIHKRVRQVIEIIVFLNLLLWLAAALFTSYSLSAPLFLFGSAISSQTQSQNSALLISLRTISFSLVPILLCS